MNGHSTDAIPSGEPDAIPRRARCHPSVGEPFDALVERVGPTGVFLCTDYPELQYSEGIRVTLFDDHGPVTTFTGQVVTWVRGRGIRVELDADATEDIVAQLAEWASEERHAKEPASTPDLVMSAPPGAWSDAAPPGEPVFEASPPSTHTPAVPLPGVAAEPSRASQRTPPNLHRAASQALRGTRVLVVDDDPLVLRMVSRGLSRFGCDVCVSDSPPRALELLEEAQPHVVLLDWVLPTIPGAEMLERIRKGSAVPIAVVSGALWWDHAVEQIRALGASAVMEKPIDFELLVDWIRQAQGAHASS